MSIDNLILFISLALLAEILGTLGGFGSSLFFVPIASFFLDFYSVLGITAIFHVTSNLAKIVFFRGGVHKKLILSIGIPAILFVIVGAFLSKFIDQKSLEFTLSIFLITISILLLLFRNYAIKPNGLNSFAGGSLSGLIAGLLGTGGAIRGITLAAFNLDKVTFIATSAIIDLGIDMSRSVVYTYNGYIHKHDLYIIAILFVVSIIGTLTGKKILTYISQERFRQFVLILILGVGIATLVKYILTI